METKTEYLKESSDSEDKAIVNARKELLNGLMSPVKANTSTNANNNRQPEPPQEEVKVNIAKACPNSPVVFVVRFYCSDKDLNMVLISIFSRDKTINVD